MLGSRWKGMRAESRRDYEERAAVDRARYNREMVVWKREKLEGTTSTSLPTPTSSASTSSTSDKGKGGKAHTHQTQVQT
jgi:hypothetical protein